MVPEVGVEDGEDVRRRPDRGGYLVRVSVLGNGPDQAEHGVPEGREDGAKLIVHPLLGEGAVRGVFGPQGASPVPRGQVADDGVRLPEVEAVVGEERDEASRVAGKET